MCKKGPANLRPNIIAPERAKRVWLSSARSVARPVNIALGVEKFVYAQD